LAPPPLPAGSHANPRLYIVASASQPTTFLMTERDHVLIIGAGIGGLTAGALLLKEGFRVTVLEAHVYPGGSAGTFYHQGYRFDAGATLAAGFGPDGPHTQVGERLGISWPVTALDPAWVVHLPGG